MDRQDKDLKSEIRRIMRGSEDAVWRSEGFCELAETYGGDAVSEAYREVERDMDRQDRDRCPECGKVGSVAGDAMLCFNATCRVRSYYEYAPIEEEETDVDKRNCPMCGERGDVQVGEHHGAAIHDCVNGMCYVHQYLVYGDDVTGQDGQAMTDDEAMLELIGVAERLNVRIVSFANNSITKEGLAATEHEIAATLNKLRKHYRRE